MASAQSDSDTTQNICDMKTHADTVDLRPDKACKEGDILKFGRKNENLNKKKWVRNDENDNIVNSNKNNLLTLEMPKKATNQSTKDTINEG